MTLNEWHTVYGHLTRRRTYRNQLGSSQAAPEWIRPGQRWWYTHERLRWAHRLLAKLAEREHLFTYLAPEVVGLRIASTTTGSRARSTPNSATCCTDTAG